MRNLKRALSLALAAVMVLGLMIVGAGAADVYEDFTDKDEIQNTEAVATMVSLGVIAGKEDGSYFDPTGTVTRGEMAKIVAVSLNGGEEPVLGNSTNLPKFSDVPTTHWAYNYIAYCVQQGIIAGRGDGTFAPDEPVTGSAAAKMFLCALGYRADLEGLTGAEWEINTNILANQDAGLYDGLSGINASDGLSRDNTAQMAYNAVQAQEVTYNNLQGDYSGVLQTQGIGTMLERRFGVLKITGIVTGNEFFSLNGGALRAGKTAIQATEDVYVGTSQNPVIRVGDDNTYNVTTTADLIGQKVVIYLKPTSKLSPNPSSDVVLGGQAIVSESNVVVTTMDKYPTTTTSWTKFLSNSGFSSDNGAECYVNYANVKSLNETSRGYILTLIDYDDNGVVDYKISVQKELAKVSAYNTTNSELTLSNGDEYAFEDVVGVEDIALNDYVLCFETPDSVLHVEKVEPVSASLDSYVANKTVTMDGTTYNMSALNCFGDVTRFNNDADNGGTSVGGLDFGNVYDLYLDNAGNLIAFKLSEENENKNYAVVLDIGVNANTLTSDPTGQVKLLLADGTTVTDAIDMKSSQINYKNAKKDGADTVLDFAKNYVDIKGVLDKDNPAKTNSLVDDIVTYTKTDNGYSLKPVTGDAAEEGVKKNMSSIKLTSDGSAVTNSSTVFFFQDSDGNTTVITGTSGLALKATEKAEFVAYSDLTGTNVAKAVYIKDDPGVSSITHAYLAADPNVQSIDGANHYFYDAVLSDGTHAVLEVTDTATVFEGAGIYAYSTGTDGITEIVKSGAVTGSSKMDDTDVVSGTEAYKAATGYISAISGNVATVVLKDGGSIYLNIADVNAYYVDDATAPSAIDLAENQGIMVSFKKVDRNAEIDTVYVTDLYTTDETKAEYEVLGEIADAVKDDANWGTTETSGPYKPNGKWTSEGNQVTASFEQGENVETDIMKDTARFLGVLGRQNPDGTLVFNGQTYAWDPNGGLKGSNWYHAEDDGLVVDSEKDETTGNTLIKDLVAWYQKSDDASQVSFTLNGAEITITYKITEGE